MDARFLVLYLNLYPKPSRLFDEYNIPRIEVLDMYLILCIHLRNTGRSSQ